MIALDMNMPDACWHCKFSIGHSGSKCFFTKDYTCAPYYNKHRQEKCPLIDIKVERESIKSCKTCKYETKDISEEPCIDCSTHSIEFDMWEEKSDG